jgi:energy-converting hydrogenase A subunit M
MGEGVMGNTPKNKQLEQSKAQVRGMVSRMAQAYNVDKKELPSIFDCKMNLISNWIYYGRTPLEQLEQCHRATGASMDWLLYAEATTAKVSIQKAGELEQLINKVLSDSVDYGVIKPLHNEGIKLLSKKLRKELCVSLDINCVEKTHSNTEGVKRKA